MTDLMKIVLALTVSGTVLAAALALLRRVLRDKLPKAVFYYLWLLVLLRLIVPAALPVPGLELSMPTTVETVTAPPTVESTPSEDRTPILIDPSYVQTVPADTVITGNGLELSFQQEQTPWHEQAWNFLCEYFAPIWLAGAALHFLWFAVSYFRFSRSLKRDCAPLLEHEQALLDNLRGEMQVTACRSPLAQTPMLLGLVRPRIVLPETAINTRELECILRHELTHLRRRDLWYKWFTVAVTSVHWFNPLMPWLRREIARCGELSCDEGVIGGMDDAHKRLYGETLLALAAANALPRGVPATTLCEEKQQLKERLLGIMKYKKVTVMIALLSVALALLVAGCAAVLGPQTKKDVFTGPLSEEQQAPVLENIKAWAEENIEADGELTVTYSEPNDNPQSMGSLVEIATPHLYDLSSNTIRPVDGIYPNSEKLGHMTLMVKDGEIVRDIQVFYLTNGDPAKGTSPVESLRQFAIAYPDAKARYVSWEQRGGQPLYIKIFFTNEGREDIFEYSGVCGRWGVREKESVSGKKAVISVEALPQMMESIVQWQTANGGATDGQTFSLVNGNTLESLVSHDILYQFMDDWETVQVYDITTGTIHELEGDYTGAVEYGYFSLLNVEEPRKWVFLIDKNSEPAPELEPTPDLTGQVAVLTKNAPLDNAFAQTVDAKGNTIVMDMAMALKKGDLVYVESQEGETCNVTVLAGEPPRVQGQLDVSLLSTEQEALQKANQVILKDTKMWSGDPNEGLFSDSTCTGVANVEKQQDDWYWVTLPGGGNSFWVQWEDLVFEWSPERLLGTDLYNKTADWLEQEFHRVYDPWYDIQSLTISNWQESGNEATFHYKKEYLYYNRDPDIVPYILEAKARSQSSYERLYQDYLALKESNYSFKIVWNGDKPTLYSDVSVKGVPEWQPIKIDDYILPWNDPEDSRKIFGEILWNAYLKGELPNGSKLDWTSTEGAAENHFAVTDIDGDGREELLLSWTNACTAGNCFVIYGCWRGAVYTQLSAFTSLRFYDNGAVEVDSSHNQGWAGRFWPFSAYTYEPKTDTYAEVGYTDGWDKQLQPEGFPDDIDTDGDGLVYEVRVGSVTGSRYERERMMDGPAFEEWRQSYLNGAQEVEIELIPLTEENIAALGAPKPTVPEVKPVG